MNGNASPPRTPRELWDPGAQPERTHQAWTRTSLALAVVALLLIRQVFHAGVEVLYFVFPFLTMAVVIAKVQRARMEKEILRVQPWPVIAMAGTVVLLAAVGLLLLAGSLTR